MKYQRGNILLVIFLFCIFGALAFLVSYKIKHPSKAIPQESKIAAMDERIKQHLANQPDQPVILEADEVLNPFVADAATQITHAPARPVAPTQTARSELAQKNKLPSITEPKPDRLPNIATALPDGKSLPLEDGYIAHYPTRFNQGQLAVRIENKKGRSDIVVYLYHLRDLYGSENTFKPQLAAAAYISSGNEFGFENLDSGYYQLKWMLLASNVKSSNKPFKVYRDNKYAYDRLFVFK